MDLRFALWLREVQRFVQLCPCHLTISLEVSL
jgi:hypothetical protein